MLNKVQRLELNSARWRWRLRRKWIAKLDVQWSAVQCSAVGGRERRKEGARERGWEEGEVTGLGDFSLPGYDVVFESFSFSLF